MEKKRIVSRGKKKVVSSVDDSLTTDRQNAKRRALYNGFVRCGPLCCCRDGRLVNGCDVCSSLATSQYTAASSGCSLPSALYDGLPCCTNFQHSQQLCTSPHFSVPAFGGERCHSRNFQHASTALCTPCLHSNSAQRHNDFMPKTLVRNQYLCNAMDQQGDPSSNSTAAPFPGTSKQSRSVVVDYSITQCPTGIVTSFHKTSSTSVVDYNVHDYSRKKKCNRNLSSLQPCTSIHLDTVAYTVGVSTSGLHSSEKHNVTHQTQRFTSRRSERSTATASTRAGNAKTVSGLSLPPQQTQPLTTGCSPSTFVQSFGASSYERGIFTLVPE